MTGNLARSHTAAPILRLRYAPFLFFSFSLSAMSPSSFGPTLTPSARSFRQSPLLRPADGADAERRFVPDRTEHDQEDPDLGAVHMEDAAEPAGGQAGGEAGGSGFTATFDD